MNADADLDVSVVLPCYNEESFVEAGVQAVSEILQSSSFSYEIIPVDDASKDKTREKILSATEKFRQVKPVFLEKNAGRGNAFICGARQAKGNLIGFLDIDMEISPGVLPEVLRELKKGAGFCLVKRNYKMEPNPEFLLRHFASIAYKRLVRTILNIPPLDTESGFKFFRRDALYKLLEKTKSPGWFFDTEITALAYYSGLKISQVNGTYQKNWSKSSTVNLFSDSIRQFKELIAFRKNLLK